jgi:hypothetical protein
LREGVDDVQINGATQLGDGWMHINGLLSNSLLSSILSNLLYTLLKDVRNIPALGRIGDPDDIIGSVRVEEGKVTHTVLCTLRVTDNMADYGGYIPVYARVSSLYG